MIPLFDDIASNRRGFGRFALKTLVFLVLLFAVDRALDAVFRQGLVRYFGLVRPAPVLCVGHSRMVLGLDKTMLEARLGRPVAKFAIQGANAVDRRAMIAHYLERHPNGVEAVVYHVDARLFTGEGLSANSYELFFPFMDSAAMYHYLRDAVGSKTTLLVRRLACCTRYSEATLALAVRGWLGRWDNLKSGTVTTRSANAWMNSRFRKIKRNPALVQVFEQTVDFVRDREKVIVLVALPAIDLYNDRDRKGQTAAMDAFAAFAADRDGVYFLDYNEDFESDYTLFHDPIHLNPKGQRVVTERLARDLNRILSRGEQ